MALFPCELCNRRYHGRQCTVYPAFVNGSTAVRRRLRCCPPCYGTAVEAVLDHFDIIDLETPLQSTDAADRVCRMCGQVEGEWTFFVNEYPPKEQPIERFGPICRPCAMHIAPSLGLDVAAGP